MDAYTIGLVILALALLYRMIELLVKTIIGFVVIVALLMIGWGVYKRRKTRRYNHEQTN